MVLGLACHCRKHFSINVITQKHLTNLFQPLQTYFKGKVQKGSNFESHSIKTKILLHSASEVKSSLRYSILFTKLKKVFSNCVRHSCCPRLCMGVFSPHYILYFWYFEKVNAPGSLSGAPQKLGWVEVHQIWVEFDRGP